MKQNVGSVDKVIRVIAGFALLSLLFLLQPPLSYLGLIGIVPLATSILGGCPLYSLMGMNTCRVKTPR
jgi:hypothetical protein